MFCFASLALSTAKALLVPAGYDEAFTYLSIARHGLRTVFTWYDLPNNHVLNSALVYVSTSALGPELIALRLPALLGAVLYFAALLALHRLLKPALSWHWVAVAALIPGMIDMNAQARGYSFAAALSYLGAALLVRCLRQPGAGSVISAGCLFALAHGFVPTSAYLTIGFSAAFILCRLRARHPLRATLSEAGLIFVSAAALTAAVYHAIRITPASFVWGSGTIGELLRDIGSSALYAETPAQTVIGAIILGALIILVVGDMNRSSTEELFLSGSALAALAVLLFTHFALGWRFPFARSLYSLLPLVFAGGLRLLQRIAGARAAGAAGFLIVIGLAGRLVLFDSPRSFNFGRYDLQDVPEAVRCLTARAGRERLRIHTTWRLAPSLQYELLRTQQADRMKVVTNPERARFGIYQAEPQDEGSLLCRTQSVFPLYVFARP